MSRKIRLGISTCPNDTFAFHALMQKLVDCRGIEFEVELLDIQELNGRLRRGEFHVAKASFHAALHLADQMVVLPSGSALGFGVGPLLLASKPNSNPSAERSQAITLCPGRDTTAALLFHLFYPATTQVKHIVFSEIMPQLKKHRADFGVCIHEGRFTWQAEGLHLIEDLGTRWETETHTPLPLGGILAARRLGRRTLDDVQAVIQESIRFALADREAPLPTMRAHAQEFSDEVLMKHVELYVNDWTVELGDVGDRALQELSRRAAAIGLVAASGSQLEIWH